MSSSTSSSVRSVCRRFGDGSADRFYAKVGLKSNGLLTVTTTGRITSFSFNRSFHCGLRNISYLL